MLQLACSVLPALTQQALVGLRVQHAPLEATALWLALLALARALHVLWAVLQVQQVCLLASYVLLALILLVAVCPLAQLRVVQEATALRLALSAVHQRALHVHLAVMQ